MARAQVVLRGRITPLGSNSNPRQGIIRVHPPRRHRVLGQNAGGGRLQPQYMEHDEGAGQRRQLPHVVVPLSLLSRSHRHNLRPFIESSLSRLSLNVEPSTLQVISQAIASFIIGRVGEEDVQEFHVEVDLEITETEADRQQQQPQPVHLSMLHQDYRLRLRNAAVPVVLEEPSRREGSRSVVESLRAAARSIRREDPKLMGQCTICMEDLADGKMSVMELSCHHLFHNHCIVSWLELSPLCPLCRRVVSS
ncbi:hypothetical protein SAY86_026770 [Trapa natans]|uniref:RING-type E3 ubiquitin transferase n=1 Tax=Trapa natans TaxID=22666 RepID=A0AAN7QI44_TRANT|nr:hypothetical protein SAY86_026770 [Trapa natans]